jgi:2'-5' RNA ligase
MPATARLFLALWPPLAVRNALLAHMQQWQWPASTRPTHADRLHLTLHFIGAVPEDRLDELRQELRVPFEHFTLRMPLPQLWRGGLAVLCSEEIPAQLQALHGQLAQRLTELALPVDEHPLLPHVTLARQAQGARVPMQHPPVIWQAQDGYVLVRSLPGGQGYQTLQVFG